MNSDLSAKLAEWERVMVLNPKGAGHIWVRGHILHDAVAELIRIVREQDAEIERLRANFSALVESMSDGSRHTGQRIAELESTVRAFESREAAYVEMEAENERLKQLVAPVWLGPETEDN